MKKIICLLAVLLLSTLHTVKVDAEFISHKNMVHIEKISSACMFPLLYVALSFNNRKLFYGVMIGLNGINTMVNIALGSGYEKDKKYFLRMIQLAITLGSLVVDKNSNDKAVKKWCKYILTAGMLGTVVKEVTDECLLKLRKEIII